MSGPHLHLRCGCAHPFREKAIQPDGRVCCPAHGLQGVARTERMPAPRILGTARGPHVTTQDLSAFVGRLAGSTPAVKKESD